MPEGEVETGELLIRGVAMTCTFRIARLDRFRDNEFVLLFLHSFLLQLTDVSPISICSMAR
jgi:hypothetical protein